MNTKRNPNSLKNLRQPWRPGESGNPSGTRKRPYTDRLFDQAEARLPEELRAKFNDTFQKQFGKSDMLPPGVSYADVEVLRLHLNVILKGDVGAASFISDRIEGKPPNRLDLIGHERQEITIIVKEEKPVPYHDRVEELIFRYILTLIEQSTDDEDENFLTKAAELAEIIKHRAQAKGQTINVPAR